MLLVSCTPSSNVLLWVLRPPAPDPRSRSCIDQWLFPQEHTPKGPHERSRSVRETVPTARPLQGVQAQDGRGEGQLYAGVRRTVRVGAAAGRAALETARGHGRHAQRLPGRQPRHWTGQFFFSTAKLHLELFLNTSALTVLSREFYLI